MPGYVFVDGPLAEQETSLQQLPAGDEVVVEVIDLFEDPLAPPRFVYVIEGEASRACLGRLRFARDAAPDRAGAA